MEINVRGDAEREKKSRGAIFTPRFHLNDCISSYFQRRGCSVARRLCFIEMLLPAHRGGIGFPREPWARQRPRPPGSARHGPARLGTAPRRPLPPPGSASRSPGFARFSLSTFFIKKKKKSKHQNTFLLFFFIYFIFLPVAEILFSPFQPFCPDTGRREFGKVPPRRSAPRRGAERGWSSGVAALCSARGLLPPGDTPPRKTPL